MTETKPVYAVIDVAHLSVEQIKDLNAALVVMSPHQLARLAELLNHHIMGTGFGEVMIVVENKHLSRIVTQESKLFPPAVVEVP